MGLTATPATPATPATTWGGLRYGVFDIPVSHPDVEDIGTRGPYSAPRACLALIEERPVSALASDMSDVSGILRGLEGVCEG